VANCIIIVQGFLLIPLFIRYLGSELYGYWLATGGILAWLSMVDVGGDTVARQRCAHAYGMRDFQRMVNYFWHGLAVTFAVVVVFLLILFIFAEEIPVLIHANKNLHITLVNCLLLAGFASALNLLELFFRGFAAAAQRNFVPVSATALGLLVALIVTIVGLTLFQWGLYALAVAAIVRALIPLAINIVYCSALLKSTPYRCDWSRGIFRDYFVTTPSVFAAKAANVFSSQLPLVLLARWYGPDVTVAFTITMRLLGVIGNFINQPIAALSATSAHLFGDSNVDEVRRKRIYNKIAKGFLSISGSSYLAYTLFNHGFIALWVSEAHYLGWKFSVLAAFGSFLMLRNSIYSNVIISSGAIRSGGYFASFEKLAMIPLHFIFIFFSGSLGAVISVLIAALIMQFPYHLLLKRQSKVVATSLITLQWCGLPIGIILLIGTLLSPLFVHTSWLGFLGSVAVVSPLLVCAIMVGFPDVRLQILNNLKKAAIRVGSSFKAELR
jgi:O-antigen/teichoic acid export membrane protein